MSRLQRPAIFVSSARAKSGERAMCIRNVSIPCMANARSRGKRSHGVPMTAYWFSRRSRSASARTWATRDGSSMSGHG